VISLHSKGRNNQGQRESELCGSGSAASCRPRGKSRWPGEATIPRNAQLRYTAQMNADDDPLEIQQWLCETSLPLLFETYDEAAGGSRQRPVVVLLDCGDEVGGRIARAWLGDEAVDDALADYGEDTDTAVYAQALSFADAQREVSKMFPYLAAVFETPDDDQGFLVISVTAGGASALTVPLDARPDID
jgi:hypothetical protein